MPQSTQPATGNGSARAPLQILRWLGREDAPLLFRLRADWQQWRWGMAFLRQCTPARLRHNIRQLVALGNYSRDTLKALRAETDIQYDQQTRGILHFYTNPAAWRVEFFDDGDGPALGRQTHGDGQSAKA